ncbi:MAG: prepilin-type N-terminal cleavage/methylation domain-containing protein [Candidimonas sp.]
MMTHAKVLRPPLSADSDRAPPSSAKHHLVHRGFTLVELSVALVVIALIVSAVLSGRDLLRSAGNTRMIAEFVQGWMLAYDTHVATVGRVPGDSPTNPSGKVGNADTPLCNSPSPSSYPLNNAFLAHGIQLPHGRAHGSEDRYVYQDSRGLPHELRVCFQNVPWSEAGASQGVHVSRRRNVMVLSGVTPELAMTLDKQVDGRVDARFGRVREDQQSNLLTGLSANWSRDERSSFGGTPDAGTDESQSAEMTVYIQMSH